MSERENPLLRWARLKQAAKAAEETRGRVRCARRPVSCAPKRHLIRRACRPLSQLWRIPTSLHFCAPACRPS